MLACHAKYHGFNSRHSRFFKNNFNKCYVILYLGTFVPPYNNFAKTLCETCGFSFIHFYSRLPLLHTYTLLAGLF